MSRGHFIGLNHHRIMLRDRVRMELYQKAVMASVRPGDVVFDLGTGTGVLALWAARAGARKVYAVDPAPIVRVAKRLAQDNEGGDRVEFFEADAREIEIPELADVLITECMGNFFVTDDLAPVLRDARRFLKPDARVVPQSIDMLVAPVFMPQLTDISFWSTPVGGLDLSGARHYALQTTYVRDVDPRMMMAKPALFRHFSLLDAPSDIEDDVSFVMERGSTIHGFVGWFDAQLTDDIALSTAPGQHTHWAQLVFPIEPVSLPEGTRIDVHMNLTMDTEYNYRWRWSGRATSPAGVELSAFEHDTDTRFE